MEVASNNDSRYLPQSASAYCMTFHIVSYCFQVLFSFWSKHFGYLMLAEAQRNHTSRFITLTLRRLIQRRELCHTIQRVLEEIGVTLYSMSQKILAVFVLFLWKKNSDTGGRPMPEICRFICRPEHSRGEHVVKKQEDFFKWSFKTAESVVQKQRMFRHCYLLNMNEHPEETSVGCWVNNRRRMANGATSKTAGLLGPYAGKIACTSYSSERG
jgi:hypothetical protein